MFSRIVYLQSEDDERYVSKKREDATLAMFGSAENPQANRRKTTAFFSSPSIMCVNAMNLACRASLLSDLAGKLARHAQARAQEVHDRSIVENIVWYLL